MEWPSTHISHLRALYPEILVLNWPQGDYNLCQIPCGSPKMERRGWGEREGGGEGEEVTRDEAGRVFLGWSGQKM